MSSRDVRTLTTSFLAMPVRSTTSADYTEPRDHQKQQQQQQQQQQQHLGKKFR